MVRPSSAFLRLSSFVWAEFPKEWLLTIPGTTAPTIFSMLAFASHDTLQEFVFVVFFLFFSLGCEERWFHFFKTCSPLKIGEEIIHFSCASIFQMGWGTSTNHPASSLVTWMMKNQVLQVHGGKYPQRIASTLLKQLFVSSESGARFTKSSENHQIWRRQLLKTNKPFDCF